VEFQIKKVPSAWETDISKGQGMGSFQELSLRPAGSEESGVPARPPEAATELDFRSSLQQLAERAQYITGASGIAIALRESGDTHMVCEGSSGRTAPEIGARLQVESGITAECVRTRKILRCDHASNDPRVNAESCRALGIESVLVLPLMIGDFVVGILEFGEEPAAFQERDVKTLEHVGEMVQTLVLRRMQTSAGTGDSLSEGSMRGITDRPSMGMTGVAEQEISHDAKTPLPGFLARLAGEAEDRQPWHWGAWLRQNRRNNG
jgi:L-methionine (R)-S-oxide reductase